MSPVKMKVMKNWYVEVEISRTPEHPELVEPPWKQLLSHVRSRENMLHINRRPPDLRRFANSKSRLYCITRNLKTFSPSTKMARVGNHSLIRSPQSYLLGRCHRENVTVTDQMSVFDCGKWRSQSSYHYKTSKMTWYIGQYHFNVW